MSSLRDARTRAALSQRALAARAGLSFRGLQLLESEGHDARLSSLSAVTQALGHPVGAVREAVDAAVAEPPFSLRNALLRVLADGDASWRTHLMDTVDEFRRAPTSDLLVSAPPAATSELLLCLAAGVADSLATEAALPLPAWTASVGPLAEPWFVAGRESLVASALIESPVAFRSRNVFVLANFLARA